MILDFPYTPSKHLAQVNYEQAKILYDEVLIRFRAFDINAVTWFRIASDRRAIARDFYFQMLEAA